MLLCDAAQEANGKLYVIGGGWSDVLQSDQPMSMALAIVLHVPWDQTNMKHEFRVQLQTADGEPWMHDGGAPIQAEANFEIGRPPGIKPGSELNAPIAPSFHGVLLPAGGYVWKLTVDGEELGRTPFTVGQRP